MHELVEAIRPAGAQVLLIAAVLRLGLLVHVFAVRIALVLIAVAFLKLGFIHRVVALKLAFGTHLAFHHREVLAAFVNSVFEFVHLALILAELLPLPLFSAACLFWVVFDVLIHLF